MPTRVIEVTELAEAIHQRLSEPDVTVRGAAEKIGVSPQTVLNWADGGGIDWQKHQGVEIGLARFLGVSPLRVLELAGFDLSDEELGASLDRLLQRAS